MRSPIRGPAASSHASSRGDGCGCMALNGLCLRSLRRRLKVCLPGSPKKAKSPLQQWMFPVGHDVERQPPPLSAGRRQSDLRSAEATHVDGKSLPPLPAPSSRVCLCLWAAKEPAQGNFFRRKTRKTRKTRNRLLNHNTQNKTRPRPVSCKGSPISSSAPTCA